MTTVKQQISRACANFVEQVLDIVRSTSLEALCAAAYDGVAAISPAERARLAAMNKITVACPATGCEEPGVRRKNNFCAEHARDLPTDVKEQLREAQRAAKSEGASELAQLH